MFLRSKKVGNHTYVQLVENSRDGSKVRRKILASLGRLDRLRDSGALDRLLVSGARLSRHAAVLAERETPAEGLPCRVTGPALVFERVWQLTGCQGALRAALRGRRFRFDAERAVFLAVLHRLLAPGSDRSAIDWKADQAVAGASALELQHLYRAMAWLGGPVRASRRRGAAHAPRCVKDEVEESLYLHRRDLLTGMDLFFFDMTSHYFH